VRAWKTSACPSTNRKNAARTPPTISVTHARKGGANGGANNDDGGGGGGGGGGGAYAPVPSYAALKAELEARLEEYNEANAAMRLVLFQQAMEHAARVARILDSPR
jgi:hypothetical protein